MIRFSVLLPRPFLFPTSHRWNLISFRRGSHRGRPSSSQLGISPYWSILGGRLLDFQSQEYGLPADYTHRQSREVKLISDRSGKTHSEITSEVAAQFSLSDGKESASTASPNTAIDHDEAPVQIPPGDSSKPVNIAAFAPPIVAPGDDFSIQIVIHSPEQLADAKAAAEALDAATELFKTVPLNLPLSDRDKVRITIEGRGAEIQSPDQEFIWRGYVAHVAFAARLPTRFGARQYKPLIRVFVNGAPAGIIELKLQAIPNSD